MSAYNDTNLGLLFLSFIIFFPRNSFLLYFAKISFATDRLRSAGIMNPSEVEETSRRLVCKLILETLLYLPILETPLYLGASGECLYIVIFL